MLNKKIQGVKKYKTKKNQQLKVLISAKAKSVGHLLKIFTSKQRHTAIYRTECFHNRDWLGHPWISFMHRG